MDIRFKNQWKNLFLWIISLMILCNHQDFSSEKVNKAPITKITTLNNSENGGSMVAGGMASSTGQSSMGQKLGNYFKEKIQNKNVQMGASGLGAAATAYGIVKNPESENDQSIESKQEPLVIKSNPIAISQSSNKQISNSIKKNMQSSTNVSPIAVSSLSSSNGIMMESSNGLGYKSQESNPLDIDMKIIQEYNVLNEKKVSMDQYPLYNAISQENILIQTAYQIVLGDFQENKYSFEGDQIKMDDIIQAFQILQKTQGLNEREAMLLDRLKLSKEVLDDYDTKYEGIHIKSLIEKLNSQGDKDFKALIKEINGYRSSFDDIKIPNLAIEKQAQKDIISKEYGITIKDYNYIDKTLKERHVLNYTIYNNQYVFQNMIMKALCLNINNDFKQQFLLKLYSTDKKLNITQINYVNASNHINQLIQKEIIKTNREANETVKKIFEDIINKMKERIKNESLIPLDRINDILEFGDENSTNSLDDYHKNKAVQVQVIKTSVPGALYYRLQFSVGLVKGENNIRIYFHENNHLKQDIKQNKFIHLKYYPYCFPESIHIYSNQMMKQAIIHKIQEADGEQMKTLIQSFVSIYFRFVDGSLFSYLWGQTNKAAATKKFMNIQSEFENIADESILLKNRKEEIKKLREYNTHIFANKLKEKTLKGEELEIEKKN